MEEQKQSENQEITQPTPYVLDGINTGDVNVESFFASEQAFNVIRLAVEAKFGTMSNGYKERIDELQKEYEEQIAKLIAENNEMSDKLSQAKTELSNAKLEIEDITAKRDAAAAELTSAKAEIERLNDHVQDLRTEIAIGAKAATRVVDTNLATNLAEEMEKFKQSRPAIYDVQQSDNKGSQFTAKLAETDEKITFTWLEKGKYREVTAQEAEQFRRAAEEQKRAHEDLAQPGGVEKADVVELPTQFQTEEDTADGVAKGNVSESVAGQTVTREEFEELKRRVVIVEKMVKRPEEVA
ncbi:chromosome segregation ATPase [Paenibacillus jamilae]|nr:chromosome segregation ATPase [Paenibacillus jamilae]